ncbi:MAG: WXG100 family type VII secretion target [Thermocrispum sp.]
MSEPLSVDTDGLTAAGRRYGDAADRVRNAALRFAEQVAESRDCFGGDKEGQQMNAKFGDVFRGLYGGMLTFAGAVDGTGDGVQAMADQFAAAEDHNAKLADSLRPDSVGFPESGGVPDLDAPPATPDVDTGGHHGYSGRH